MTFCALPQALPTPDELKAMAKIYLDFTDQLRNVVVDRDHVLEQMKYALIMRQHVLIFGPPGTAKTNLCDIIFDAIDGAERFAVTLSMFMGEDAVYGPYDVKKMRDEGVLEHRVDKMLPNAHIARLGEFLDANLPLQRSLLDALHERRFRRGGQMVDMPLITVYADTNKDPGEYLAENPYAWAVLDRILFMSRVDYLNTTDNVAEMLRRFQDGKSTFAPKKIDREVIDNLSRLIVCPPSLIHDPMIYTALAQGLLDYRQKRGTMIREKKLKGTILPEISDRRFALASQMLEAEAVLDGRLAVIPEDMRGTYRILGTTPEEKALWMSIVDPLITKLAEQKRQQLSSAQTQLITRVTETLESVTPAAIADIVQAARTVAINTATLEGIVPDNDEVRRLLETAMGLAAKKKTEVEGASLNSLWGAAAPSKSATPQ